MRLSLLALCLLAQPLLAPDATGNRVSYEVRYTLTPGANSRQVTLTTLIPQTIPGRQKITSLTYSHEPARIFEKNGSKYAEFVLARPKEATDLVLTVEAELSRYDLSIARQTRQPAVAQDELKRWLVNERYLEKDSDVIKAVAQKLTGKTDLETVEKTLAYVTENLKRGPFSEDDRGALWMLKEKSGDCTDFADVFVALCRANQVPARFCEGYLMQDIQPGDTALHNWAEVYLDGLGWIPLDPLHAQQKAAALDRLRPIYVLLDTQRRNSVFNGYHYYSYRYQGDAVQVKSAFVLKSRQPLERK